MIRMDRILCPADFSPYSFRAADYAVALARHYRGEVHFLHAVPRPLVPDLYPYLPEPVPLDPETRERARDRLDAFVALSRAEGVKSRLSVLEGDPVSCILETAGSDRSNLICLGTHGRSGLDRLVLGSVTEKVIRKATCPVLTVSEPRDEGPTKAAPFQNIVCAVDFSMPSLKAIEYSLSLVRETSGRLTLFHALEWVPDERGADTQGVFRDYRLRMEEQSRDRLERIVPDEAKSRCEVVVRTGRAYRELLTLARELGAELIVMGVRGRNPMDLLIFGSTTAHIVRQAECPVLTIPERGGPHD
jgi:nucleotide-binding universal stress UspA family protein